MSDAFVPERGSVRVYREPPRSPGPLFRVTAPIWSLQGGPARRAIEAVIERACALVARAEFFITGDCDFPDATKRVTTTIISPSMFKRLVIDTWA